MSSFYTSVPKTTIIGTVPEIFFVILGHFFPFYPSKNQENQNAIKKKKMEKVSGDVIILHMCTKNHNYMHASWDMEYDRHNFLSFRAIFCPFTPQLTPKIKIWNKCKKPWRYYPITHVYHKWRSYDVWFIRYKTRQSFLSFWKFCALWLS